MNPKYHLASLNQRIVAKLLDGVIAFLIFFAFVLVIVFGGLSEEITTLVVLIGILFAKAYLLLADSWDGRSIGKRLCGLRVVNYRYGYPCKPWQSVVRNIAGFGILRLFQLAEEEDGIAAGTFTGEVVVDLKASQKQIPEDSSLAATREGTAAPSSKIDFEGIHALVRKRRNHDQP